MFIKLSQFICVKNTTTNLMGMEYSRMIHISEVALMNHFLREHTFIILLEMLFLILIDHNSIWGMSNFCYVHEW